MKKFVFADTSTFLYFQSLDEIDLPKLLRCAAVELVLPPVVIGELEWQGWDDPRLGVRKRAEYSLKKIRSWTQQGNGMVRPGVEVTLCQPPAPETFQNYHLNNRSRDDLIIASVLEYTQAHGKEAVMLLTDDMRRQFKAQRLDLQTASLPSQIRLQSAQEAVHGETARERKEVARYQPFVPEVELRFGNGSRMLEIRPATGNPPTVDDLDSWLEELRARCEGPLRFRNDQAAREVGDREAISMLVNSVLIPEEEFERYGRELDSFLEACESWLHRQTDETSIRRRAIRLDFELANSGGAMAEGVILTLTLPKKLRWHEAIGEDELPDTPDPPRTYMEIARESISELYKATVVPWTTGIEAAEAPEAEGWLIEGQELRGMVDVCPRYGVVSLKPVYAVFADPEALSSFTISYVLNERNTTEPVDGRLLVRLL